MKSSVPIQPNKPRIYRYGPYWMLDTGHDYAIDLSFYTWAEALDHAQRICDDYQDRIYDWIADGNY